MNTYYYNQIEETLVHHKLLNGLEVYIVPKSNYHTVHGVLSVDFGSVHRHLRHLDTGKRKEIPAGAAHFLEHKMFENEQGEDVSQLFTDQGAMVNAFTSQTQTNYIFSAAVNVEKNILTLLDFVLQAQFTSYSVEREKGIIQQELSMYEDDPYANGYQQLIRNLYPNHVIGEDILGTPNSIEAMTYEDLELCFRTFYRLERMRLIIVGDVEPYDIIELLESYEWPTALSKNEWQPELPDNWDPTIREEILHLDVSQPVASLGVRLSPLDLSQNLLKSYLLLDVVVEMLFGPTSINYTTWYHEQLLDMSFSMNTSANPFMHHITLEAVTDSPRELLEIWRRVLANWREQLDMNEAHFEMIIRGRIGDFLRELDNLEGTATELAESLQYDYTHFDVMGTLLGMTYSDVIAYAENYLSKVSLAKLIILPINE